jgi:hypothetical protein
MAVKEKISRIPWGEYLSKQFAKIIGLGVIAILLLIVMIYSANLDLEVLSTIDFSSTDYLIVIILSSIAFLVVLIGFTRTILFEMADEFGLRDATGEISYNLRFWLFALLILSFCYAIYILLDVQLDTTYLVLLPILLIRVGLDSINLEIPELLPLTGREYYQTVRNFNFDVVYTIIVGFSVIVFLSILTTFARRRILKRFRGEEEEEELEKQGIRTIYKLFFWILIPPFIYFALTTQITSEEANEAVLPLIQIIILIVGIWWTYQTGRILFLTLWRGVKFTAFLTIVNLLVIVPLIGALWLLPVIILSAGDVMTVQTSSFTVGDIIREFILAFLINVIDFASLVQVDFIIITSLATLVVGFAEGFAIIAIITALFKGVEVARTGKILVRSPPKVVVLFKYLALLGIWVSLLWESFAELVQMLELGIVVPDFFTTLLNRIITPISKWLADIWPILENLPFLLIPVLIIFSGAFKFLSVTLIIPRIQKRGEFFFLLISTSFVLIVTNILGYIYELGIPDAPLISFSELLSSAVYIFADVESLSFYGGFFFGIGYVFWQITHRTTLSEPSPAPSDLQPDTDAPSEKFSEEELSEEEKSLFEEEEEESEEDIMKILEENEVEEETNEFADEQKK